MLAIFFLASQNDIESNTMVFAENNNSSDTKSNTALTPNLQVGMIQWLETNYPASGTGVVRVIDPDMNLDPETVDNFDVDVWSNSDDGGIDLTVTETNDTTGIFEGIVFFTITDESSGHRLRVAEGDTVTAQYKDSTLPDSDATTEDELVFSATAIIGSIMDPCFFSRCASYYLEVNDVFGNSLSKVHVNQEIHLTTELANPEHQDQPFVYLLQIKNSDDVVVYLKWTSGLLSPGQSFSQPLSWIPTETGTFIATAFVWNSIEDATPLRPIVSTPVDITTETK